MQEARDGLSSSEFRIELINRFFHSKSYFFRCLNREFETLLNVTGNASSEENILFGNLLDKLVSSKNKTEIVDLLSKIEGFEAFHESLNRGIRYLREARLNSDELKAEIETLARTIFNTSIKALREEKVRQEFKRLVLGEDSTSEDEAEEMSFEPPLFEPALEEDLGKRKNELEEHATKSVSETVEPLSEESHETEPDVDLEADFELSDAGSEERESPHDEKDGRDTLTDGGCEFDLSEESGSTDISESLSDEPDSLSSAFKTEMSRQVSQLKDLIYAIESDSRNPKHWHECDEIFDAIAGTAMIYGFEPFEQIALKFSKFLESVCSDLHKYSDYTLGVLKETQVALSNLIDADLDAVDEAVLESLAEKMQKPSDEFLKKTLNSKPKNSVKPKKKDVRQNSENEHSELKKKKDSEKTQFDLSEENPSQRKSEFKLPGEDDEEIVRLVNEITSNYALEDQQISDEEDAFSLESESRVDEETNSVSDSQFSENPEPKVVDHLTDDQIHLFKEQAEFYFNVIEDALSKLKNEPKDKTALEDLELASHSLNHLTLKLSLESLSKFPATVEELIGKIISTTGSISERERQIINEVYQQFREIDSVEDIKNREFKELLNSIKEVSSDVYSGNRNPDSDAEKNERSMYIT